LKSAYGWGYKISTIEEHEKQKKVDRELFFGQLNMVNEEIITIQ
jgi:hypothetical protein